MASSDAASGTEAKTGTRALAGRGWRLGLGVVTALGVLVSAAMLGRIGAHYGPRWDMTATGEHRLSPQSIAVISAATDPIEVVLSYDSRARTASGRPMVDPQALDTFRRVLERFGRTADSKGRPVTVTELDLGKPTQRARFEALLDRLLRRDLPAIQRQIDELANASGSLLKYADAMRGPIARQAAELGVALVPAPDETQEARAFRDAVRRLPGALTAMADDAEALAERTRKELPDGPVVSWPLPPIEELGASLRPGVERARDDAALLAERFAQRAGQEGFDARQRELITSLASALRLQRDELSSRADALASLTPPPILRAARTLQAEQALVFVGDAGQGLAAIDFETLFPASLDASAQGQGAGAGRSSIDQRVRSEELIASGLSELTQRSKPIVVLVHGDDAAVLGDDRLVPTAVRRLRQRGMDVLEWRCVGEERPPSVATLDPSGTRPVVYVVQPTFASSQMGSVGLKPEDRASRVGEALALLVGEGSPVLVCLPPSQQPMLGSPDPLTRALPAIGITASTGTPVLREVVVRDTRDVLAEHVIRVDEANERIGGALLGLQTMMLWPVAIEPTVPPGGTRIEWRAVLTLKDDRAWSESLWSGYYRVPREQRGSVVDKPTFSERDDRRGPVVVAAAVEARSASMPRPQRAVVVGSAGWFMEPVVAAAVPVDGRVVPQFPGNLELLEASVLWLAGQDDRIAQSASARTVSRIGDLDPGTISAIRWALLGAVPALIVLSGIAWRVLRG